MKQLQKENKELQATASSRKGDIVEILLTINQTLRTMQVGARATCHKQSECGGLVHAKNQLDLMIQDLKDFHKKYHVHPANYFEHLR